MRTRTYLAVLLLVVAMPATAQTFFGRALLEFQRYDYGVAPTSGFRQQYDLRLTRSLTDTAKFRIFLRADDFRGNAEGEVVRGPTDSRQLQPMADLIIDTFDLHVLAHAEMIDNRSTYRQVESRRTIERAFGTLEWAPEALPRVTLSAQRNVTTEAASALDLTDDYARAAVQHEWRGFSAKLEERYAHSGDPNAGYDRKTTAQQGDLNYNASYLGGRLAVATGASAQRLTIDEEAVGTGGSSVPTPVPVTRALWSIDDTPLDSRDHPPAPNPALIDGNSGTPAGVSLSPEAVSFQNLVLDLARVDRMDEIRIVVRDGSGNPLRNGGGPVTWDLYTSEDGQLWSAVTSAQTTFSNALSLYSVTFDLKSARWFKVVNFGVNIEQTFVTEVQAFYHTAIGPGQTRSGNQNLYNASATVTAQPSKALLVSYTGAYSRQRQELSTVPFFTTTDFEHIASLQYDLLRTVSMRGQYLKRFVTTYDGRNEDGDDLHAYVDYRPTGKATLTLELGRQNQMIESGEYTIDTRAVHFSGFLLRSIALTADLGQQRQTFSGGQGSAADRTYANLTGTMQLLPSLRTLISGTMQRTTSASADPELQILGPQRDNRLYAEFIYRPGRELMLSARYGFVSAAALSGFVQRYHVDWYPFGDGTVALGGSYDQDIDPTTDRRATRLLLNPRWMINRWASFDLNYMSFTTSTSSYSQTSRSFFATLTLTR